MLFGSFSWRFRNALRTCGSILETIQTGIADLQTLANAWDDEQRANGLAWKTRARRRGTLRSFIAFAERSRAAPCGIMLAPLARERIPRGSIVERIEAAIDDARTRDRSRDAAILTLLWDRGSSAADVQRLAVGDLPLYDVSDRCALALSLAAASRPASAWIFPGRDHRAPIDGETIRNMLTRYGLPGIVALRRARARRLSEIGNPANAARALAGED